jgi:hypothetical protein
MSDQPEQLREGQVTPSIDINDRKDRALIRTAVSRRWPVKQELREKVVDALDRAMTVAQEQGDRRREQDAGGHRRSKPDG